jgi:hypothetical protein
MRVQVQLFLAPPPARVVDLVCLEEDLVDQAQEVQQRAPAPVPLFRRLRCPGNRDAFPGQRVRFPEGRNVAF